LHRASCEACACVIACSQERHDYRGVVLLLEPLEPAPVDEPLPAPSPEPELPLLAGDPSPLLDPLVPAPLPEPRLPPIDPAPKLLDPLPLTVEPGVPKPLEAPLAAPTLMPARCSSSRTICRIRSSDTPVFAPKLLVPDWVPSAPEAPDALEFSPLLPVLEPSEPDPPKEPELPDPREPELPDPSEPELVPVPRLPDVPDPREPEVDEPLDPADEP